MWALFDILLLLGIVFLAWRALADADLFRGVMQFIGLGLLVAVAWVRLRAPDVALAEAAVGSGLTGALLLAALARGERRQARTAQTASSPEQPNPAQTGAGAVSPKREHLYRAFAAAVGWLIFGLAAWAVWPLPSASDGLALEARTRLSESGVSNPVTAALLNYRGYDTLLEVAVLLLAIVGVWSLRRADVAVADSAARPLFDSLLRWLLPLLMVGAGYLLWIGSFAPGGAFQAGALLGGGLVLGRLAGWGQRKTPAAHYWRAGLALGLLAFAGVAALVMKHTGGLLQYPAGQAGPWILAIEAAATLSIGLTLGALFAGGRPSNEPISAEPQESPDHE